MAETAAGLRRTDMAGYILTGGKSRRMHGQDKLFLDYQGEAFCDHIRRALGSFPVVYLSAAPDGQKRYASLGLPVVADVLPGLGPMGGIYSGLLSCREPWLFVAACDMPLIRRETVDRVTDAYLEEGDGDRVTVVRSGDRVHPLFGIYPRTAVPLMEEMIREGNYRMRDFIARSEARVLSLEKDSPVGVNINTEEEYQRLR
ncbi:MAG: molybdenum cofactor guanylyltransferase [Hungatella sp.]|nr:molybdenum cofactor guanylyltransferase [Hungatella sp.]